MSFSKVGVMTPGDMGQAVAMQIRARGFNVFTALDGRSQRSHQLAREAGLVDLRSIARLVDECDVVLSIMNPGAALEFGRMAAVGLSACARDTMIVDCNAISPDTARAIGDMVTNAGGRFVDGGIIGPPPRGNGMTHIHVSGPEAELLAALGGPHLAFPVLSRRVGDASGLKMCSAALTKGTQALWLEVLCAATRMGVYEPFISEVRQGARSPILDWVMGQLAIMAPKAGRWVPEMHEISATMQMSGITPKVFDGIAEICACVARTPPGNETPEEGRAKGRSGEELVRLVADVRR